MNRAQIRRQPSSSRPAASATRAAPASTSVPSTNRAAIRLSQPGDASERAADRMAHEAVHGGKHAPAVRAQTAKSGSGERLPDQMRGRLEAGFGTSLDDVRVHTGSNAAAAAQAVSARAFAIGSDIAFGAGQFQPGTTEGQELIAHEVAHTLQPPDAGVINRAPTAEEEWTPLAPVAVTDPLRLSYADFLRLEDQRRQPLRQWLDTNTSRLRLLSTCALTARVREAVPEASRFADLEIGSVLNEWAAAHGFTIPRLSAVPHSCEAIGPAASGPSIGDTLANSDLVSIVSKAVSLATDGIDVVKDNHGRFNVSASGLRVELSRGAFKTAGVVGFTGGYSVEADAGDFHFRASLDSERWAMSLSFGTEQPARLNAHLGRVFTEAEAAMRRILASAGTMDPAAVKSAVTAEMQRVTDAVEALSRAAALAGPRVSVGVGAVGPGPGLPGPSTPPGTSVEATITVWF
jgi:hypothetical protein